MHFGLRSLILIALILQLALVLSSYWDISVARQVVGFLYLTFVPGVIILKFLKLENLSLVGTVSLSVGISVAFLMFLGLLLNELLPLVGFLNPLSIEYLIIVLSMLITLLCLALYIKAETFRNTHIQLSLIDKIMLLILICLPVLSVSGTLGVNIRTENSLLLLFFLLVSIFALVISLLHQKFTLETKSTSLFIMYFSILMVTWLMTNYIFGYDSHLEFYSFKATNNASYWNPTRSHFEIDKGNAMLSITILPTIYSKVMGLDPVWVFKIVYPLLAAFVPLALYQLFLLHAKKDAAAFLGVFLFITHSLDGLGSIKEWIATIFYVLLFFIIFSEKIPQSKRKILFIIFAGGLVVSHYSKSYIFMVVLILMWMISFLMKKNLKVTLDMVLLYLSMTFAWYIFTLQGTTFEALLKTFDNVFRSLTTEFANPESRGSTVMTALGLVGPPTYLHLISRIFFYLTVLLILVGFVSAALKFWKERSEFEYFVLVCINMGILALTIILPNLAPSYNMTRFYRTALIVLAPLCFLGSEEIVANLHRLRLASLQRKISALFLTCAVLIPFFLFQTGFFYEVAKVECWSIPLSGYRMPPSEVSGPLLYGADVSGAIWLSRYTDKASAIYADIVAWDRALTSYGLIDYGRFRALGNTTRTLETGSLIYLRRLNIVHGIMVGGYLPQWNTTDMQPLLNKLNQVYSNGECNIYKNP